MLQRDVCPGVMDIALYDTLRTLRRGWDLAGCRDLCDCTAVNLPNISAVSACAHGWTDRSTAGRPWTEEPSVSVWPETWMYSCTGAHQPRSLNQCGPILPDTSALCCRNLENPTCASSNLNTAVAVVLFFLFCLCAVQTDDAKINLHIFSS